MFPILISFLTLHHLQAVPFYKMLLPLTHRLESEA